MKFVDLKSTLLKIIFSFLNENKKLNIIINNKTLQKKLEVNIENYKQISNRYKRYKIGERNGKGKEYYDNGKLIFEGEYINGERNKGIGIEYYDNGKIEYEGEYINGERNGKGKEYYDNGKLRFEGEYLNGEKNGIGKEYDINGELE